MIGSYISQKAYQKPFIKGNIYEASIQFLQWLAEQYKTKPIYSQSEKVFAPSFSRVTQLFEASHDFSQVDWQLEEKDKEDIYLWQSHQQKKR